MVTVITSFVCLFGLYELFSFIGILDFSWAIRRGSYHSYTPTISGDAHWVYKGSGRHVRDATREDIEIHNRNANATNKLVDRKNADIRKANKGAAGRGFSEWRDAPFYKKYALEKRWFPPTATIVVFLFLGYFLEGSHLLFTGGPALVPVVLFAVNVVYVCFFTWLFLFIHNLVIGGAVDNLKDVRRHRTHTDAPKWSRRAVKRKRVIVVLTFIYKAFAAVATVAYIAWKSVSPLGDATYDRQFFVCFIVLSVLWIAYFSWWFFSGEGGEVR